MLSLTFLLTIAIVGAVALFVGILIGNHFNFQITAFLERSSNCTWGDVPAVLRCRSERKRLIEEAEQQSKLIEKDANFDLWATPIGNWWMPKADRSNLCIVAAEQKSDIYSNALTKVQPGDIVIDCGAHVGTFTRTALNKGAKLVVAVEPAPENQECLRRNLAEEIAAGKVVICPRGLWDSEGVLTLVSFGASAQHAIVADDEVPVPNSIKVPVTTIDSIVKQFNLERVDFIKMDIEGAEEKALEGAKDTIAAFQPRLAIAGYHNREDHQILNQTVAKLSHAYKMTCSAFYSTRGMRPESLFFQPNAG